METLDQEIQEVLNKILTGIAQKHLNIQTLETQNSDSLDFYNVAVWSVKEALRDAFIAGMTSGMTVGKVAQTP